MTIRQSFFVMRDPVGSDVAVFVKIQMQNASLGSISRNELGAKGSNELIRVLHEALREAVHSKVNGSQTLDSGIVREHTDISSGPEVRDLTNKLDIVSFDEQYVCLEFK